MSKTIGIIGGLGPAATADFFAKLIAATPARADQEHFRVLIDSNPRIPDRNAAIRGDGPSPAPQLIAAARNLERAGAELLVLACNTAHFWQREIEAAVAVAFLSMIDETANAAAALGVKRIGVLAADGARAARLYPNALQARGIETLELDGAAQRAFMETIYAIKAGEAGEAVRDAVRAHAQTLIGQGAEAVIAGCTEIPLALTQADISVPLLDSTEILVRRVVAAAR